MRKFCGPSKPVSVRTYRRIRRGRCEQVRSHCRGRRRR